MKNEKARNDGLEFDFLAAVVESLPTTLTNEQKKFWLARRGRRGLLAKRLREALGGDAELDIQFQEQLRFYQEVFGLTVDAANVPLPPEREGFGWLLLVPAGMTMNLAWAKCKERFKACHSYLGDDLDKAVPKNERDPAKLGTYAVRFRDRVEADEEWKNTSANTIAQRKVPTITLLERLLLELWYHWKTSGKHLDIANWTLCCGSRLAGGRVPRARLRGGPFRVRWRGPDDSGGGFLRPREAAVSGREAA